MIKKIASLLIIVLSLLSFAPPQYAFTTDFDTCRVVEEFPDKITDITPHNSGYFVVGSEGGLSGVKYVHILISRTQGSVGQFIDESLPPPTHKRWDVIDGNIKITVKDLDTLGGHIHRKGKDERLYITLVDHIKDDHYYCATTLDILHVDRGGECNPIAGNPPGQLTPDNEIILKVPDIPSRYSDSTKLGVWISRDAFGVDAVENSKRGPSVAEVKDGYNMRVKLTPRKDLYYFQVNDRYEPDFNPLSFDPNVDFLCKGPFRVDQEGGGNVGLSECKIPTCPPSTRPVAGSCRDVADPKVIFAPITESVTCRDPYICPTDGSSTCQLKDADLFRDSFNAGTPYSFDPCPDNADESKNCKSVKTGLPGLTLGTSAQGIGKGLLGILITVGGAVAFIIIIITGYRLMTSGGDPEKIKAAREQLTSAIVGLLFIIFSISILSFLGVDVLGIFGP